jgi:hypothetical protein
MDIVVALGLIIVVAILYYLFAKAFWDIWR